MIISLAIVKGYQIQIRNKITGFTTHIQISRLDLNNSYESQPVNKDTILEQLIKAKSGVVHLQRYALKPGIIKTDEEFEGVVLKGVDDTYKWDFLKQYLTEGTLPSLESTENTILISSYTSKRLHLKVGDKITMYFVQNPPRARRFNICGIYDTGFGDMDKLFVFSSMRHITKLNGWDANQITGYEIETASFDEAENVANSLVDFIPYNLQIRTVSRIQPELFDWLNLLDLNVLVIIILMIVVACINMITALLMLIVERSNMIGILKALGLNNNRVGGIFRGMSVYLIVAGLLIGDLIGLGVGYSQHVYGWFRLDPEAYYLDKVPVQLNLQDFILINVGTFIICYFMMILPSRYVSRISPARSIKFE